MPLSYRKRGKYWHFRGTIRIGDKIIKIIEKSTGCSKKTDAETVGTSFAEKIRKETLEGKNYNKNVTISECFIAYIERPGVVKPYDIKRCMRINDKIGNCLYFEAEGAWQEWLKLHGKKLKPSSIMRQRATLQAALNQEAKTFILPLIKVSSTKELRQEGTVYLTKIEQDLLLLSYNRWVAPIALMLCYQGMRTQEALRSSWKDIDWNKKTIFISQTKIGKPRTVPMHPKVCESLYEILKKRNPCNITEKIFLSQRETLF